MKNGSKADIREVYQISTRLEEKIDNCVTKDEFEVLVLKVDCLNNWKWKVTGFAGGIGAVIGVLIATLKDIWNR